MNARRVAVLSDVPRGGAAAAGLRLAAGAESLGLRTRILHAHPSERLPHRAKGLAPLLLSTRTNHRVLRALETWKPDVVHAHNIHGGTDAGWTPRLLTRIAERWPVIWTLHDQWSMTGRCAYPGTCTQHSTACDDTCPTADAAPALWRPLIRPMHALKHRTARHPHIYPVSPSTWLARAVARMPWHNPPRVIKNAIPLDVFRPRPRSNASERARILLGAVSLNDPRKGADIAFAALRDLDIPLEVVTFGALNETPSLPSTMRHTHMGSLNTALEMAALYASCDFYVHPAREDNLPNTIAESLACGTPVVALPVGGIPEMLDAPYGWLAPSVSADGLRQALRAALALRREPTPRRAARAAALSMFDTTQQSMRYAELYEEAIHAYDRRPR